MFLAAPALKEDQSTLSSYNTCQIEHTLFDCSIDWKNEVLDGKVTHKMSTMEPQVCLDTSFLEIESVEFNGQPVSFTVETRQGFLGSKLVINKVPVDVKADLVIKYKTTNECTGLQFLKPVQTMGGKAPFLFSQCEPIHARSIMPCFDTPSVKVPFDFEVRSEYPVVVSGIKVSDTHFVQKVPIPSYLFAIASGNFVGKAIGPRSTVYAEPEWIDKCQYEFENDTERQLQAAEELVFDYEWKNYDVLVLPPSFPFGGMENPQITFATPTLISGDRTLVNVIAHELAHSWSGNLVSNKTWSHFWLNEGWTVYIERRILGKLEGESYRNFAAYEGWQDLVETCEKMPLEYTKLRLEVTSSIDPDDTFSTVPYEKGSAFLWYLETQVGREQFDKFIKAYFTNFKYKSLDTDDFKNFFNEYFHSPPSIDWDLWLDTPGLPPKPDFDLTLVKPCEDLASKWAQSTAVDWATLDDIAKWHPLQVIVFLNLLDTHELSSMKVEKLGQVYKVDQSTNAEIKFRWLKLATKHNLPAKYELCEWLGEVGRMKFVRPSYQILNKIDRQLALDTFKRHEGFYHSICRTMVAKDLGLE